MRRSILKRSDRMCRSCSSRQGRTGLMLLEECACWLTAPFVAKSFFLRIESHGVNSVLAVPVGLSIDGGPDLLVGHISEPLPL